MSEPQDTSVAIIIAAYNAQATVARAVSSALAEPEVREVFVVDDASQDDTGAAAQSADDGSGRLKVLRQEMNGGPSAARNRALVLATTAWVGVLDADDFFLPGRIAALLKQAEQADLLADDMWQVQDGAIEGLRRPLLPKPLKAVEQVDFIRFVGSTITREGRSRGELSFIKPIMRRAFMEQHAVRYQEQMRLGEDFEIYARLIGLGGRLALVPNQGYVSVVRHNSLSAMHSIHDLQQLHDCHDALARELTLTKKERAILNLHRDSIDRRLQWRRMIEAVKQRRWAAALGCFKASWATQCYLVQQLVRQAYIRARHGTAYARAGGR